MLNIPEKNMRALNEMIVERRRKLSLALTSSAAQGARGKATIERLALHVATLEQLRDLGIKK